MNAEESNAAQQSEAERCLRENQRRLATLLSNLPGMAYRCRNDTDWTMELVSDGCEALTGYSASDLVGAGVHTYNSLIHPDDRDRIWNEVQEALKRGLPFRLTYRIRTADGREKWVWEQGVGVYSGANLEALEGFITDITDRKDAEAKLKAQYERFQTIIEHTDAGYFRIGMDGCFEDVNPAWLRMYGFASREEAIGLHFSAVQVQQDIGKAEETVDGLVRGESVASGEFSRLRRDGAVGYHTFSANPVLDGDRVIGLEGFLVDITDRKTADLERQRSEQRYSALFNSMQEGVAIHKLSYRNGIAENYILLDVNRRYEEILGVRREDVVDRAATDVYESQSAPYLKEYASVVQTGTPLQFETYFPPMDKYFVISVAPLGDCRFATIFFDVTAQRRTEERYKLISENAADVIWLWDPTEGRCIYVSPSVRQLRGFAPEEVMAQPVDQAISPDSYGIVKAELQRRRAAIEAGDEAARIGTNEIDFLRKDGTCVSTETVTKLLSEGRQAIRYVLGVSRDITERKRTEIALHQLEDQLRQAQKLESVGRLAGGIAHDFNNLLTVINGYSGLILEQLKPFDPLHPFALEIANAGDRAASLTKQLLAFSRKQVIEPRVFDLNTTIRQSAPMLQRLIGEDISLQTELDDSLGQVLADPDQIHQVIMNLAVNARDAMPAGGRLEIRTANADLNEADGAVMHHGATPGRYVLLTVTDSGHGMDETIREHIFEPFFTTKETGKGTGLGLSTVYGIVRQSGGWIDVWSEVGSGTSLKVYLPRTDGRREPEREEISGPMEGGRETILVVEDQQSVRSFAAAALRQCGYHVIQASDGDDAISAAGKYPGEIHLLLTDVVMPGISGKVSSERLKEMRPGLKVLFMSGYTADIIAQRGVLDRDVAFLHKPFSAVDLAAKVREVLAQPSRPQAGT
jgi:two-component system, cell cycle sensor histidine kinase and response regulator CckA